jgi:hypothetical protein
MSKEINIRINNSAATASSVSKIMDKILDSDKDSKDKKNKEDELDYLFDPFKASDRNNSFLISAMGNDEFYINPILRGYKKRFFESKYSAGRRWCLYIDNIHILEKLTSFVLLNASSDQKDKWNKRREMFSISINSEDHPFLLEYLKSHKNKLDLYFH